MNPTNFFIQNRIFIKNETIYLSALIEKTLFIKLVKEAQYFRLKH